ncbi:hypothetical protein JRQ81_013788, partial [Phrynocephalus forsythii]
LTPLDLALQNGHVGLAEIFSKREVSHPFEISKVDLGENAILQFAHSSGTLSLTFNRNADRTLESDIHFFRKYFLDTAFPHKNLPSKQAETLEVQMPCDSTTSAAEDLVGFAPEEPSPKNEDVTVYRDRTVQVVENEGDTVLDLVQPHSSFEGYKKKSNPSMLFAAAALNGSDEVYANRMVVDQMEDAGVKYSDVSQPASESVTDQATPSDDPGALANNSAGRNLSPLLSSAEDTADSYMVIRKDGPWLAERPARGSSLDDLDVDNGDERISNRPHNCYPSMSFNSSTVLSNIKSGLSTSETVNELDMNTNSSDLSNNLESKESILSGIRSRSYSYTSPKILPGKSRCVQDFTTYDPDQHAFSSSEQSGDKRIQEEEWDKYLIPTKSESEKYKVSRTFSFLMNRMASTRNKSKTKNKDVKEKEKLNRHQFVSGTFTGVLPCFACEKALLGKESLQCSYCSAVVHKHCKDCAPACAKKVQERCHIKNRTQTVQTNPSFRDIPQPTFSTAQPPTSAPIGLSAVKKDSLQEQQPLSRSVPSASFERKCVPPLDPETDASGWRSRSHSEELLQSIGSMSSVDSFMIEDDVDASLWCDLSTDALEFEAESWSVVVEPVFCNKQEKDVIKRQDVIFELMQTEVHHIHTLFIMSKIFRKGMKEELQMDHSVVDRIFPCLDELLELHQQFFCRMKERRQELAEEGSDRNFVISRIGDILVQQFSAENANKMKTIYGEFCSHQKEAVSLFKELQHNKKFQNFIKVRNSNLLARRRGIPECILLVTQRITKYPVLVERILQYSKEGTEEHKDLCKALSLIKELIAAVDLQVNEYEKKQKLLEIFSKIENKTYTKLKSGHVFRKQDLMKKQRTLLHEGLVYWKTATGRFKDILALLLSDVMLFLQEKDQKYIFAAVDQKPAVIALQKLIVREVANEERGMFLISASSSGPEMYEIHTSSKEERSHWMRQVQEAVESCPEEEGKISESDEDRRMAEARAAKIQKYQVILNNQDQQICSCLEEKLNIYAKLGDMSGFEDVHVEPHLLIKPDSGETPHVASLLGTALKEVENLHTAVKLTQESDSSLSSDENTGEPHLKNPSEAEVCESFVDFADQKMEKEPCDSDPQDTNCIAEADLLDQEGNTCFEASTPTEVVQTIQNLTRLLYSIQAALTIQDTHLEIHKLLLQEQERSSWSHSGRSPSLLEPEKPRSVKSKEELANVQKLQHQFQQEQQRWHRECEQRQQEHEARLSRLQEKEQECQSQEELLCMKRGQLDLQLQDYQQDLERLRESQRMVEKEREKVHLHQKILHHWKHSRQSSLPAVISPASHEITRHGQSESFCSENSIFINEAIVQMSLNHLNRSNSALVYQDSMCGIKLPSSDVSRTMENEVNLNMDISCQQTSSDDLLKSTGICHHCSSTSHTDASNNPGCTEEINSRMNLVNEDCMKNPGMCSDRSPKSQVPKYQDMNALQSCPRPHTSNDGNSHLQHHTDVLLHSLLGDMGQDSEHDPTEEKIVYL